MIKRREVLGVLLAAGAGAQAYPIEKLLGPVQDAYLRAYFSRMFAWYCREFADLKQKMTEPELELLALWLRELNNWGVHISSDHMIENFLFSHKVNGKDVNSSRFAFGSKNWSKEAQVKLRHVLRARGIQIDQSNIPFGIGWDFLKDETKVYYFHSSPLNKINDRQILDLSQSHTGSVWRPERISAFTYRQGKIVKRKLIVPMAAMDWSEIGGNLSFDALSASKIIEDSGVRWFFRLRSLFFPLVSESIHPILSKHQSEFHQQADAMIFESKTNCTFYFP